MNPKSALDGVHVFETVHMVVKNVTRLTVVVKISRQILTTPSLLQNHSSIVWYRAECCWAQKGSEVSRRGHY